VSYLDDVLPMLPTEKQRDDFKHGRFVECDSCAEKLGSPSLCGACLANRAVVGALESKLRATQAGLAEALAMLESIPHYCGVCDDAEIKNERVDVRIAELRKLVTV
jgi:hypothetical protein